MAGVRIVKKKTLEQPITKFTLAILVVLCCQSCQIEFSTIPPSPPPSLLETPVRDGCPVHPVPAPGGHAAQELPPPVRGDGRALAGRALRRHQQHRQGRIHTSLPGGNSMTLYFKKTSRVARWALTFVVQVRGGFHGTFFFSKKIWEPCPWQS